MFAWSEGTCLVACGISVVENKIIPSTTLDYFLFCELWLGDENTQFCGHTSRNDKNGTTGGGLRSV